MTFSTSFRATAAAATALLLCSSVALAQTYQMRSSVVSGGAVNASGGSYAVQGTIGQPVVGPVTGTTYNAYQGFWYTLGPADALSSPQVDLTVYLEGPYQGTPTAMTTDLQVAGVIPTVHPYSGAPWNVPAFSPALPGDYFDSKSTAVDWVVVRLRADDTSTIVSQGVGLLLNNGAVVDPYTLSDLTLSPAVNLGNDYYIEVDHRNHLAIMSAGAMSFLTSPILYDFTTDLAGPTEPHYGGPAPAGQKAVSTGPNVYVMYSGDADTDGDVFPSDLINHWIVQSGNHGYLSADFDMDADVFPSDLINHWIVNSGFGSAVP